ncbi:NADH:flavin oxidoreductase/NADH oxidase [Aminomonas paucivorans DSM 12260]|uniref:NADH:flavin oxidoreductase/NADH oxidase n=1 Tax=Aminomonas paucivorans DSM 12260 TaxID=584708 RepID=E3CVC8_9BACT|nr:NADH:flavin oxidoreductase/NADH oxidase [Aminomonas paucivorans]EFQ22485.1 NADH:flavin oxidoreductase/NADH oxidase [Aminomonas paucivorans DSM 12260]
MNPYPHLFSPVRIGGLTARNRIESAPGSMGDLTPEGYLTRENVAAYEVKAGGGAAIVTIGESNVHTKTGKAHGRMVPLDDDEVLPSLINTTDAIKHHGALASIELIHPGRRANPRYYDGPIYGPSAGMGPLGVPVTELDEEHIEEIVEAFGDAAEMAKLGGVDLCMVHAGHGWLLHQFLSPLNNQRTDRFGGSLENRGRFALLVLENIKKKCGADFPVEFRISGSELTPGGFDLDDMVAFAGMLDGKLDLLNVSDGTFHVPSTNTTMVPSMFLPHGCNAYLAAAIKKGVRHTKVAALGWVTKPILQACVDGWLPSGLGVLTVKHKIPYVILTLLYLESLAPIFFEFNISTIGNMAVILNNVLFALVCFSAVRLTTRVPELWAQSRFHVSTGTLKFWSVLGGVATLGQTLLLFSVLKPYEMVGNGVVLVTAAGYAVMRKRSGKVHMEISYEEA